MSQTLFEVLSMNERIVVWSNEEAGTLYTWNQSATLQCFAKVPSGWEEVSMRTLSREPRGFNDAREAAKRWDVDGVADDR